MQIMVQREVVNFLVGFHLDRKDVLCHCVVDEVFYGVRQCCPMFCGDLTVFQQVSWRHGLLGWKDCVGLEGFLARYCFQRSKGM